MTHIPASFNEFLVGTNYIDALSQIIPAKMG